MLKEMIAIITLGLNGYAAMESEHMEKLGNEEGYSVTVCHVEEIEKEDGNTFTVCENYKDSEDVLWLDGEVGKVGNDLMVTFYNDDPVQIYDMGKSVKVEHEGYSSKDGADSENNKDSEELVCKVTERELYGWSEEDRYYPCVNVDDYTDYVEVYDNGKVKIGDVLDAVITDDGLTVKEYKIVE